MRLRIKEKDREAKKTQRKQRETKIKIYRQKRR